MTSYPQHDVYLEDEEGALSSMPFKVAHALLQLSWHEAWTAALRAEEAAFQEAGEDFLERLKGHKKLVKEAREAWSAVGLPWASGPRGGREGAELVQSVGTLAQTAAKHCAAMRIYRDKGKSTIALQEPAREPFAQFEAASRTLEEMHSVLAHKAFKNIVELIWAVSWHVANTIAGKREDQEEEEEEDEDEAEEDEDEKEDEDEDEDEDEEAPFGENYPGSSDDPVEDMRTILSSLHDLFGPQEELKGVRLCLASEENLPAVLESISRVPGAFQEPGLNAVRLVLPDWSGCAEALDSAVGELLLKAESLELKVVLELPAVPGKAYETWLRSVAGAVQSLRCVVGVALPRVETPQDGRASGLVTALRQGGLSQDRCACFLQLPTGDVEADQEELFQSSCVGDAAALPVWLADGCTLFETPAVLELDEDKVPPQMLLDAASALSDDFGNLGLVSSWSLSNLRACKTEGVDMAEIYREFAQRMISSAQWAARGWFFEGWKALSGENLEERSLETCLERGWVDLSSEVQVMYPHGSGHTASLIYLHGFTCDGYSYLAEPYHFYRPKAKAGKKKKGKAKKEEDEDEEEEDLEPYPGLKVLLPTAPQRPITCYKGEMKHAWYDYITDHEGEREDELSAEDLQQQTERIHKIIDAEVALVGARNVFLGGASQGCGTALHIGLTYPGELGGLIGTMGHLLSCTPVSKDWLAKKIPVYTYNGLDDSLMKWDLWTKATYERLVSAGADIRMVTDEGVDHGESEDIWIRRFLNEVLKNQAKKKTTKKSK